MKAATSTITPEIDVQALRVGMFVHLDVGWMSHPFPLSSFRITTAAQVATIRSLGLARVRWSPQDSDLSLLDGGALTGAAKRPAKAAANDADGLSGGAGAVAVEADEADGDEPRRSRRPSPADSSRRPSRPRKARASPGSCASRRSARRKSSASGSTARPRAPAGRRSSWWRHGRPRHGPRPSR